MQSFTKISLLIPARFTMRLLILFSIFLSFTAFAQNPPPNPYTLEIREGNHFRNWTFAELKSKISINQDAIELNVCNGNEKLLLPDLVKSNPKKDSLKILNSRNNKLITYIDGVLLDHNDQQIALSSIKDRYTKAILDLIEELRALPEGERLISLLQQALYPITIAKAQADGTRFEFVGSSGKPYSGLEEATSMQHFVTLRRSEDARMPFQQFGAGGVVHFDPNTLDILTIESDHVSRPAPVLSSFAHELFHSFDSVRGLMDRRGVNGAGMEPVDTNEYRGVYFENVIRKHLGRKYRKYLLDTDLNDPVQVRDSMLDKNGQPYLIPTPCLNK